MDTREKVEPALESGYIDTSWKLMEIDIKEITTIVMLDRSNLLLVSLDMRKTPMMEDIKLMAVVRDASQMLVLADSPAITSIEAE